MRGYIEEGTTTTPFDMTVLNRLDRFDLAIDVIDRVPRLRDVGAHLKQRLRDKLVDHKQYITAARRRHARGARLEMGRLNRSSAARL